MRTLKSVLWHTVRAIIAAAAVINLVLLFVWSYKIPANVQERIDKIRYGDRQKAVEVSLPGEEVPEPVETIQARLVVPSQAINYSGGDVDILSGVYIEYPDGTRDENTDIEYDIEEGSTRLDKVVHYKAELEDGQVLTGDRTIRINNRYTGPTLTVTGEIPDVTPDDDIRSMVIEQIAYGNVYAEDGFGNDITSLVRGRFDKSRGDDGEEIYTFILYITNAIGDTDEVVVSDEMYGTGVVMRLTTDELTLNVGTPFYYQDYIEACRDAQGNDLHSSLHVEGTVNSYAVGDYELTYYCVDSNGTSSPKRTLKVHIV
ncbi:MAG: DUF5011 domain-containing protein [Blautia sp.]|nr:DUF5011 domain-containing protein [Blautia sp.]